MEQPYLYFYLNVVICAGLAWTSFCRILYMDRMSNSVVRAAVVALLPAAVAAAAAPWVPQWGVTAIDMPSMLLRTSLLFLLAASAPGVRRRRGDF